MNVLQRFDIWLGHFFVTSRRKPCDVCRLGRKDRWEPARTARSKVSWYFPRVGEAAKFRLCEECATLLDGREHRELPFAFLREMVRSGRAERPSFDAYWASDAWRLAWREVFIVLDAPVFDDVTAREEAERLDAEYFREK